MSSEKSEDQKLDLSWQFILIVMIVAFFLRMFYVFTLEIDRFYFDYSLQFHEMAVSFLDGKGFMTGGEYLAFRMPVYPLFLAGMYRLFGVQELLWVRVVQSALSALTILFMYLTAARAFNEAVGKITAVIASVYPFFIYYSGAILTETVYILLISITMWFLVERRYAWGAIFIAISTLTKAEMSGFLFFAVMGASMTVIKGEALKVGFVMVVLFIAVMAPWTARNYLLLHRFVPLTTLGGTSFWEGNNPQNLTGGLCRYFPQEIEGMDEVQRDRYLKARTVEVIKSDPKAFFLRCGKKFLRFWNIRLNTNDERYASRTNNLISMFSFGPILLFAVIGFILSLAHRFKPAFIYFFILYTMLVNLVFISSLRYRLPIEPYLIMFAGYALYDIFRKKRKRMSA